MSARERLTPVEHLRGKWFAARTLAGFALTLVNWQDVWSAYRRGLDPPPLRLRHGPTLHHAPGDDLFNLFREIFLDHCYTRGGFYHPKAGDTVLDLGSNVGLFALYLEWRARGIRVHCFEPGPTTRERLRHNVSANGLDSFVTIHPFAISDHRHSAQLKPAGLLAQRSLFESEFTAGKGVAEEVECVSLADALELAGGGRVALLKMDIEGAEIEAVAGAPASFWEQVERVVFEYHDRFRPGCREAVLRALRANGFHKIREPREAYQLNEVGIVFASRK